jgi:tRNA(Ile)-lysidine synthetase-like protein
VNTFKRQVLDFIRQEQLIHTRDRLVIACSGGVDSMALLSFCMKLQKNMELDLIVAHVDHMLRGEVSLQDRRFVESFCAERGLICESVSIDIPTLHKVQSGNLQALCRSERYTFLQQVMQKHNANKLVTAHHADDQLESLLMALVKSLSVASLQGISMRRPFGQGEVIRPFLMVTKDEIREYLQSTGNTFREDASNAKDDYTRNRIRHKIVPVMKQQNLVVSEHAVILAQQLAEDESYLQAQAYESFERVVKKIGDSLYEIGIEAFQNEPVALQRRLILILLNYIYNATNTFQSYTLSTAVLNLMQSMDGSSEVHLPNGFKARRYYDLVMIGRLQQQTPIAAQELQLNEWRQFIGVRMYIGESSCVTSPTHHAGDVYFFSRASVAFPLRVRARQPGDKLHILGMDRTKKLSRIFIDEKVPLHLRDEWPILVDNNDEILATLGIRVSNIFSKSKRPEDDLMLIVERLQD